MSKEKTFAQVEKYAREGKLEKAIKELAKLSAEDPKDLRVKLKLADLLAKKRETQQAISLYREVAASFVKENSHLKAIAVFKTILKLNPSLAEVNVSLGDLFHDVGMGEDALHQYEIAVGYFENKGKKKEELEIQKKIVEIDRSSVANRTRLAELYQQSDKMEEALQEYESVAELHRVKKNRQGLIEIYEKILYFKKENLPMLRELCQIYFDKREFKKVLRRIEASKGAVGEDAQLLELWAEALLEDRQREAARKKFLELYQATLTARDEDRATRVLSRILQEFSDDQDYLREVTHLQKERGFAPKPVAPKYRQDFEKTEMIDLSKADKEPKKR